MPSQKILKLIEDSSDNRSTELSNKYYDHAQYFRKNYGIDNNLPPRITQKMIAETNTALADGWKIRSISYGQVLLERESNPEYATMDGLRSQIRVAQQRNDDWAEATDFTDPIAYSRIVKPALDKLREAAKTLQSDDKQDEAQTEAQSEEDPGYTRDKRGHLRHNVVEPKEAQTKAQAERAITDDAQSKLKRTLESRAAAKRNISPPETKE